MTRWRALIALLAVCAAAAPVRAHENTIVHRGLAYWSVDILGSNFYSPYRTEIGNGAEQEDVPATRSLGHFYNPQTNSAPWFALGSGPATTNSRDQYNAAVSAYLANNLVGTDAAFHRLGRAMHFIEDMTSPAHTHDDDHATGDDFEDWGPGNFPSMNFASVTPKIASPATPEGFVAELATKIYNLTVYPTVLYESAAAQPNSVFKQMFPSLHFETGGFFVDDHFVIDRIGDWGCDLLCADDWWIPDELLTTDNGGPGGVVRHTGSAYIENSGGDGGPVVPTVFNGVPNSANENLLQIYGRLFYPDAIAYGAGLLQVFAATYGPSPTPTASATRTATATGTATNTALPASTSTATPPSTSTATFTATATAISTPTATATRTSTPTAISTHTATPTPTVTATPTASASGSATGTRTETPTTTPTPTSTPLCVATPRGGCGTPGPGKSLFQLRDATSDKALWRWSRGDATLVQFGRPEQTAEYALCVYDNAGGAATLAMDAHIPPAGTCGGAPCWKPNARGFKYSGRGANADGIDTVILKEGFGGRAKILVKMKGAGLALPAPFNASRQFEQNPAVRVQLVNSVGACWEATFLPPAFRNEPGSFKDKSD